MSDVEVMLIRAEYMKDRWQGRADTSLRRFEYHLGCGACICHPVISCAAGKNIGQFEN